MVAFFIRNRRAFNWGGLRPGSILAFLGFVGVQGTVVNGEEPHSRSLVVEEFEGGTGASVTRLLKADLATCGRLTLLDEVSGGAWKVGGESVGGKIEGTLVDEAGKTIFSRTYAAASIRENIHMMADDVVFSATGASGIAGSLIAFVSDKSGSNEIYMAGYNGENLAQITRNGKVNVSPSISPDGVFLIHTGYGSGYADIYLVDLGNGESRRIVNAPGTNAGAAVSPGARRMALTMSFTGNPELFVTGVAGGEGRRLSHSPGVEADPAWSPDGGKLVFVSDQGKGPQLIVVEAGGGTPRTLDTGFGHCTAPDWSPDGKRIAFNARQGGKFSVAIFDLDSGKSKIFRSGVRDPCWGPDGRYLAYADGGSLLIEDVDLPEEKRERHTVVEGMGRVSEPTWTR